VPRPQVGAALTLLDVPHLQQPQSLCVPTSAAMVLQYFGDPHDPRELKTLSRSGTWDPAKSFSDYTTTSFADMLAGLRTLGYRWSESDHANDAAGFAAAAAELKSSLRQGNPVLVDTTLYGGHVFVVAGFDESQSLFYVRDPNLAPPGWRALTSAQLQAIWNSSRTGFNGRGALLAARRS
jgi:uncharacterized protein YvpB